MLAQIVHDHRSASQVLASSRLDQATDRALVQALVYGVLRHFYQIQGIADALIDRPLRARDADVRALVLLGIFELMYHSTPAHAAVALSVEAARELGKSWATGLVNGVLRRFQRERSDVLARVARVASTRFDLPDWLLDRLRTQWPQHWQSIADASLQHPPMVLRVNARRATRDWYLRELDRAGIAAAAAAHTTHGIVLDRPTDVSALPGFDEGFVSVQDAAAQLVEPLLVLEPGLRVLDACAAPGGKTAHMLEHHADLGELLALDVDAVRLERLSENLRRLGLSAAVEVADACDVASWWNGRTFDRILLDVPCSATGVIRRHPDIKVLRRTEDISALNERQLALLSALWSTLAPGGILLYVTCSVLQEENEQLIGRFLEACDSAAVRPFDAAWGEGRGSGRQILTGQHGMDGFFLARLTKLG